MSKLNFIQFAKEKINNTISNSNNYLNWGIDNRFPVEIMDQYDSVPEHSASIDFIENLIIGQGLNIKELDYWLVKKIVFDYILFGGYALQIITKRNEKTIFEYIDISKCRYTKDKKRIIVSENWYNDIYKRNNDVIFNISENSTTSGVYIFKNNKTRMDYPRPYYLSGFNSIDTFNKIIIYHNNNATNGFSPNVLINIPGEPEPEVQRVIEENIKEKYSGNGQKFLLSFNADPDVKTTIEKLQDDNLDAKFKDLQLFLRDEIIISHKLTSGSLIGVNQNTGFNNIEYIEALKVFKENVILGFRNELSYSLTKITGIEDIKFLDIENKTNITVNQTDTTEDK